MIEFIYFAESFAQILQSYFRKTAMKKTVFNLLPSNVYLSK